MRPFLKMTHSALVFLLGLGGVLSLFLWVNSWGQWVGVMGEIDFSVGSQFSFLLGLDDIGPPWVHINTPGFGLDGSFDFAGLDFDASQSSDGTALVLMVLPWWLFFTFFSLYPAIYLIRRKRTATEGKCVKCGYDLRGSKHRCPECGLQFDNPPKRETQDVSASL